MFGKRNNKDLIEIKDRLHNIENKLQTAELAIELMKTQTTNLRAQFNRKLGEVSKGTVEEKDLYNGMLLPSNGAFK